MNSITKKVVALGVTCALAISPMASLNVNAYDSTSVAKLQSISNLDKQNQEEDKANYSDDTIIVKYSRPLSISEHRKAGGTVIQQVSGLQYVAVKVKNKNKLQQTIQNYQKNSKVESVQLSPIFKQFGTVDPKLSEQYVHSLLKTANAQKLAGKHQVKVAVIDTGIDKNHPELKGSIQSSSNIIDPMNPTQADIHGTHVAGIIAAKKDNGIGGYGINPSAKILSYDVFGGSFWTFDYTIANAILEAVEDGADVINMSLGSSMSSTVLQEAVEKAISKGVVVVAAAGNDGADMQNYPASYEGVISVGAINSSKKLSNFSTYGASIDVVAPGEKVYAPYYDVKKGSSFANLSGTSMASPAVAGTVALLLSKNPKLTPAEVEYILEKTATDLGAKGFDNKFGNGLINPVEAMKYDVKKIPSLVTEKWDKKAILNNADSLTLPAEIKHSFTKPSEQKWVKLPVEKGEYIQVSAASTSAYDYKMSIHFYGDNQEQLTEINDVKEGKTEAKLIQAPFSGTVAIGVKDVNGSYDDSLKKRASITLKVDKAEQLPEDESTLEAPIKIEKMPFNQENLYITGEKGDSDFFHFTTNEAQFVKFDVSGIPGVDISASVYDKNMLFPDYGMEMGEDIPLPPTEEVPEGVEIPEGEEIPSMEDMPGLFTSNSGGIGEGETLTFQTEPGQEYYVKVTNKRSVYDYSFETVIMPGLEYIFSGTQDEEDPAQSLLPYHVNVEAKVIQADEDNYPGDMMETKETEMSMPTNIVTSWQEEEEKRIAQLEEISLPYEIGGKAQGYLQNNMDQDWFKLTTTNAGIYQFDLPTPATNMPVLELYEIAEGKDEKDKPYRYLSLVSSNRDYYTWPEQIKNTFIAGLKADQTYFLSVVPNYSNGQIPYDGYEISSKLLVKNTADAYEANDKPEDAKNFPAAGVKANFSVSNDIDTYYFTAKETATYGINFFRSELTKELKNKYKSELLNPFYGFIVITEDVNKNRKAEDADNERSTYFLNITEDGTTTGSFKMKKGKSYFVTVLGMVDSPTAITLWPYELKMNKVNTKDEDAGSKVNKFTPSKPISLKKIHNRLYTKNASLNSGSENGDEDWFVYTAKKTEQATITLDGGKGIDGVIEVYRDGKRVAKSDYYGINDNETFQLKLTKGKYYIKVKDSQGHASFEPYTLTIKLK